MENIKEIYFNKEWCDKTVHSELSWLKEVADNPCKTMRLLHRK